MAFGSQHRITKKANQLLYPLMKETAVGACRKYDIHPYDHLSCHRQEVPAEEQVVRQSIVTPCAVQYSHGSKPRAQYVGEHIIVETSVAADVSDHFTSTSDTADVSSN